MNKTLAIILVAVLFIVLVAVFFITYVLNKRTPIPESCRDLFEQNDGCENCSQYDCAMNKIHEEIKEAKKHE